MKTRYSKKTGTFYPLDLEYSNLPEDLIEVSAEDYTIAMTRPLGHTFDFVEGNLVITEPAAPTLAELKKAKLTEISRTAQAAANSLTAGYPEFEKMTWENQSREALAWDADNNVATPYIDSLAEIRGITRVDYLKRVLSKTKAFNVAAQKLVGLKQKYEDQVKAATTPKKLAAINPRFDL